MSTRARLKAVLLILLLASLEVWAAPPDLTDGESFWARSLAVPESNQARSFDCTSHSFANFTTIEGVTGLSEQGSAFSFDLGVGPAVLAWGNSASNNDGRLNGTGFTFDSNSVSGHIGNALEFDGVSGQHVDCGTDGSLSMNSGEAGLTLSLWVKMPFWHPTGGGNQAALVGRHVTDYLLTTDGGNEKRFRFWKSDGAGGYESFAADCTDTFAYSAWNHIAVTFDAATRSAVIYCNGDPKGSSTMSSAALYNADRSFTIGKDVSGNSVFEGAMDDVRVYNRPLSAPEISDLYGGGEPAEGLIGHWKLDEVAGTLAADSAHTTDLGAVEAMWQERNDVVLEVEQNPAPPTPTTFKVKLWANGEPHPEGGEVTRTLAGTGGTLTFEQSPSSVFPTPDGFRLEIEGEAGTTVTISQVKLKRDLYECYARREFVIPAGEVWRAVADMSIADDLLWFRRSRMQARLYINGQLVQRRGTRGYLYHTAPVDISDFLITSPVADRTNCVAIYGCRVNDMPFLLFQSRILMTDGSVVEVETDSGWRIHDSATAGWNEVGYDDSGWASASNSRRVLANIRTFSDALCLPGYGGPLFLQPFDGRKQFIYTEGEDVELQVRVPAGLEGDDSTVLHYYFGEADTEGNTTAISDEEVSAYTQSDDDLLFTIDLGDALDHGVYTVSLELRVDGSLEATRQREPLMVLRRHDTIPIEGASYTEGLDLTLEHSIDFTDPAETDWVEAIAPVGGGTATGVTSPKIVHQYGLTYREVTADTRGSFFSYRIGEPGTGDSFAHPGDWYLLELDYPDDADRLIEMSLTNKSEGIHQNTKAGVGALTGRSIRKTFRMKTLRCVFVADTGPHSIDIVNSEEGFPAAAAALRVYHITGGLPSVRMGESRSFGIHTERVFYTSGIGNLFGPPRVLRESESLMTRNLIDLVWMEKTADRFTQYLRFAGQNNVILGGYQYSHDNSPALAASDV